MLKRRSKGDNGWKTNYTPFPWQCSDGFYVTRYYTACLHSSQMFMCFVSFFVKGIVEFSLYWVWRNAAVLKRFLFIYMLMWFKCKLHVWWWVGFLKFVILQENQITAHRGIDSPQVPAEPAEAWSIYSQCKGLVRHRNLQKLISGRWRFAPTSTSRETCDVWGLAVKTVFSFVYWCGLATLAVPSGAP